MEVILLRKGASLEDLRIERHKRHQLLDILILTVCAVIRGAQGWEAINLRQRKAGAGCVNG